MELSENKILDIGVNDILPSRFQPRIVYDDEELIELSDSIKKYGMLQPLIVRKIGTKYEIIAGERRYKASILAGNKTVPVILMNISDNESAEIALIENIQRKNLTSIEEAMSYQKALDNGKVELHELSERIGKDEYIIESKIRLLDLSDDVQEALINNKISEGHARSLLKLNTYNDQNNLLERIINERLTVRRTDEEIEKILNSNKEGSKEVNNDMNFMFNNSQTSKNFNIFSTNEPENGPEEFSNKINSDLFSTEPAAPTFINNNAPIFTQVSSENNTELSLTDLSQENKPEEPMFVLFDDDNNNSLSDTSTEETIDKSQNIASNEHFELKSEDSLTENSIFSVPPSEDVESNFNIPSDNSGAKYEPDNVVISANNPEKSPIIISDFNKQFDPVMPSTEINNKPKIDMRSIINMIRNCQKEIENLGYEIELDEYDLADTYQVTFKIMKK